MTQSERVLRQLQKARCEGTNQGEWLQAPPDGGTPITRLAARISDLQASGHHIITRKSGSSKFVTYLLGSITAPAPDPEPDPDDEPDEVFEDGLFELPPVVVPDQYQADTELV